jgi:hypothetical protein
LGRSGELLFSTLEERNRIFVDPKLDGDSPGRAEPNANQLPTKHGAEAAVNVLGIDLRSFGQDHSERSFSEIARQIRTSYRRAEDACDGSEMVVGQRRVDSQEDEGEVSVVTLCASTLAPECLTHDTRVRKTGDTVELEWSSLFEAKHDLER